MTRGNTLEADYLEWLYSQVQTPRGEYWSLMQELYTHEFAWFVPNDDNRMEDGLDLRSEFLHQFDREEDVRRFTKGCSVLEVLIGLSRRLAFSTGSTPEYWAWKLLENLKLHRMSDPLPRRKINKIDEILEQLIFRTYEPNGQGGFFPLAWPEHDMTKIELWYQMSMYIEEMVDA